MANAKPANMDFTMKDLDGKDVTLSSYKGKVVLLNFWATWCGPCKAEIPGFVELQEKYKDKLTIVGFSVDDAADKARAFATEYKMNYPILLGLGREDVQDAYGPIWGIPASFIISKDGKVCRKHMGIAPKAVFEKEIVALRCQYVGIPSSMISIMLKGFAHARLACGCRLAFREGSPAAPCS